MESFFFYSFVLALEKKFLFPEFIELPLLLLFIVTWVWLTLRKAPIQYLDIQGKVMNMTVQRYNELHSLIKRMYKVPISAQRKLYHSIEQQLKYTNASLKRNFRISVLEKKKPKNEPKSKEMMK